jgi:hypothetical protein
MEDGTGQYPPSSPVTLQPFLKGEVNELRSVKMITFMLSAALPSRSSGYA